MWIFFLGKTKGLKSQWRGHRKNLLAGDHGFVIAQYFAHSITYVSEVIESSGHIPLLVSGYLSVCVKFSALEIRKTASTRPSGDSAECSSHSGSTSSDDPGRPSNTSEFGPRDYCRLCSVLHGIVHSCFESLAASTIALH